MLPVAASSAAASRRPAVQRPRTGQSRVLQRGRPGLLTSVQSPGAPPAPLAPEDDQDSELELSVRPVQGQEQPAAVPQGRAVEGLLPHHWEEHLQTLHAAERRDLRRYIAIVGRINALSGTMAALSDDELAAKTGELRCRIEAAGLGGPDPGSSPVEILSGSGDGSYASPGGSSRERRRAQAAEWRRRGLLGGLPEDVVIEGFAVVREAAHRVLGMRHYDVQLLGGLVLHEGQIAEMRTGEGKTLVATLPAYINALTGRGVHIITVNGYLAQRDAEWIGKVFKFLGLSVGVLSSESSNLAQRIAALACDVTYTTAYDLAFTYLQDNISQFPRDVVIRRPLHFALVDEADSLLIDEAINPFIITGSMLHAQSQGARWMEAVAVARALTHHSVEQLSIGEAEWQDLERQFDCLVRPRYMSADLSNRGMVSAVRTLVERGTVRLCTDESGRLAVAMMNPLGAEPSKKAGGNGASSNLQPNGAGESGSGSKGSERSSSSSGGSSGGGTDGTSNGSAPAAGAAAESAAAERAAEAAPAGAGAEAAKQPICLVLAYVTLPNGPGASGSGKAIADVRLDSAQRVEGELEKHGLQLLPPGQVTQQQLEAAMPAVMWGGSQAWGMSITTALRALHCYIRDMHYIVDRAAKRVVLIDQGTGRERVKSMWQAGVHQAVEAKEGVPVSSENYTTASVSYQSLFGYYRRLAGMTGTGFTEQQEFAETYGLAVLRVPPHRPSVRRDEGMRLFVYEEGRDSALLDLLLQAQQRRQPVLIGTGTVEESAQVYDLIRRKLAYWQERRKLMHQPQVELLNARPETVRREATIIAQAGLPGSVTIATALAGRGTDILLGGNPKGLVQMLLENRLLERLAGPDAGDLANHDCRLPLSNLTLALQDFNEFDALPLEQLGSAAADPARLSAKLALELPAEVCSAYCQLRMALAAVLPEAAADSQPLPPVLPPPIAQNGAAQNGTAASPAQQQQQQQQQLNGQAAATPAAAGSPLPPQRLPFRRNGLGHSKRAAQYAADWLGRQLEAAEMHKAQLRLSDCLKLPGAAAFQEAARRLGDAQQQLAAPSSGDAQLQQLEAALQRFILLQWLWFERMCGMYARQVRAAGGLCVIIASMPDNKRSELQLRGRAGRQGDPGETHLILSLDDPVMAVRNPGLGALPQATFERVRWNGAYTVGGFRSLVRSLEQDVLVEMEFDPRYASYSMLDAEDDAIFCSYKFQLCDQLTPISNKSVEHAIAAFEAHMRRSRNSVREYDHVLDRYRRHIYTMRRVLVQGGAAGRQRLLQSAFQDAARGIVSRLIDADQPPHSWPLLELVQWVEAVVNSCPPGEAGPFNGARWLAQSNVQQQLVQIRVNLHPAETARQLAAALRSGGALPEPQLIDPSPAASQEVGASKWTGQEVSPEEAQKKLEQVPSEAAKKQQEALAADEAAGRAAAAQPRLRERQAAAALRAQLEADGAGSGWADEGAASAVLGDVRGLAPPPQGRYAAAARQLAAWVAEQLAVQQRNRHAILKEWFRAQATTLGGGGVTDVAALDMLRVRERALLTTRLDSLWAGFLEACQRKQREVSMRSFASYNPLEEYELETSELFAQLLLDFKQQAVADVFRDVDLTSLEDAARAAATATVGEEEAAAPAGGRSGSSSVSIASSVRSIDIEAAGAAEDLGALFDRLGLGDRVAAEAERLAAADEAARRARAAAAEAAVNDGVAAAEAAFIACAATSSACCQVVQLAVRVAQEQNAAMRQLGLYTGPSAQELLRKADGLVRDVVACATECLSGPARNSMARWEDVHSALGAWLQADASHDAAAAEKAQRRLRQLREETEQDQQRARSWAVHATQLAVGIKPMLDQAVALPQQGYSSSSSSSGGASGSATSFVPLVRASEPAAAMLAANEAVVAGLHAALQTLEQAAAEQQAAVQRIQQERGEQQGSGTAVSFAQPDGDDMPDSESVAAGVASFAMLATNLRQSTEQAGQPGQQQQQQAGAQQRQLPGTTDLPSAVLAARGSPQQASSAAIDTVLAQTAGPAHASSGSYDEQAAAAAQLKQQAEQLSPEAASAVSNLLLAALQRKVFGSTSTQEALAQLTPPQEQQQQQPAGEAQPVQQPDQTASDQQRQPEQ